MSSYIEGAVVLDGLNRFSQIDSYELVATAAEFKSGLASGYLQMRKAKRIHPSVKFETWHIRTGDEIKNLGLYEDLWVSPNTEVDCRYMLDQGFLQGMVVYNESFDPNNPKHQIELLKVASWGASFPNWGYAERLSKLYSDRIRRRQELFCNIQGFRFDDYFPDNQSLEDKIISEIGDRRFYTDCGIADFTEALKKKIDRGEAGNLNPKFLNALCNSTQTFVYFREVLSRQMDLSGFRCLSADDRAQLAAEQMVDFITDFRNFSKAN